MSTTTAVYIGSCNDVRPVEQFPAFNWVFITPEPRHPAAAKHWPPGCPGNRFLDGKYFFESLSKRLGAWRCESESDDRWIFEKDGRRLTVFVNSAVGGNSERLPEEAKRALAEAKALYVHGWLPTLEDVQRLCPNLRKIISPPGLIADWEVDVRTMLGGCELVGIETYDWDLDREKYMFFDDESESMGEDSAASLEVASTQGEPEEEEEEEPEVEMYAEDDESSSQKRIAGR